MPVRPGRFDVLHEGDRADDQREPGQRDRDRILYTSALRRLAGVTQVVAAGEGHIFHNRLTHTLEVAQIARRLAERILSEPSGRQIARSAGGIDPDIVEAAALAHDVGHPPFGHVAESELDSLVVGAGDPDGFEGNAQSFRIVTKLAIRHRSFRGLNLRRATLNAILKYPWRRALDGPKHRKFGAYRSERAEFQWARELGPGRNLRSAEGDIMNWADDIAYAVHDVEDFYRAGLVPLDRISTDEAEMGRFLRDVFARWDKNGNPLAHDEGLVRESFEGMMSFISESFSPLQRPYSGTRRQRAALRSLTAWLIQRYIVRGVDLRRTSTKRQAFLRIKQPYNIEVEVLKELTWYYVILSPSLAAQQHGQRRVVRDLFNIFCSAAMSGNSVEYAIFPTSYRELLEGLDRRPNPPSHARPRLVSDLIAGMTEQQALDMHQRLTGAALGSVLDAIVR